MVRTTPGGSRTLVLSSRGPQKTGSLCRSCKQSLSRWHQPHHPHTREQATVGDVRSSGRACHDQHRSCNDCRAAPTCRAHVAPCCPKPTGVGAAGAWRTHSRAARIPWATLGHAAALRGGSHLWGGVPPHGHTKGRARAQGAVHVCRATGQRPGRCGPGWTHEARRTQPGTTSVHEGSHVAEASCNGHVDKQAHMRAREQGNERVHSRGHSSLQLRLLRDG